MAYPGAEPPSIEGDSGRRIMAMLDKSALRLEMKFKYCYEMFHVENTHKGVFRQVAPSTTTAT